MVLEAEATFLENAVKLLLEEKIRWTSLLNERRNATERAQQDMVMKKKQESDSLRRLADLHYKLRGARVLTPFGPAKVRQIYCQS